jgi:hypothetical protein
MEGSGGVRGRRGSGSSPMGRPRRSLRVPPKTAFSRSPPFHRADLEGLLRADLTRSPSPRRTTAICAFRPKTRVSSGRTPAIWSPVQWGMKLGSDRYSLLRASRAANIVLCSSSVDVCGLFWATPAAIEDRFSPLADDARLVRIKPSWSLL